jgi:hypothetical protein
MAQTLTFRTTSAVLTQLERRARQLRVPKTTLAERYVEEGLAMEAFPGIVFRDGPAGRRPGLLGGPDVWEVIEIFLAEDRDVETTAEQLGLRPGAVDTATRYYAANSAQVDEWIARNREMMSEAEEHFRGQQKLFHR